MRIELLNTGLIKTRSIVVVISLILNLANTSIVLSQSIIGRYNKCLKLFCAQSEFILLESDSTFSIQSNNDKVTPKNTVSVGKWRFDGKVLRLSFQAGNIKDYAVHEIKKVLFLVPMESDEEWVIVSKVIEKEIESNPDYTFIFNSKNTQEKKDKTITLIVNEISREILFERDKLWDIYLVAE